MSDSTEASIMTKEGRGDRVVTTARQRVQFEFDGWVAKKATQKELKAAGVTIVKDHKPEPGSNA